jgi:hypothetical protein
MRFALALVLVFCSPSMLAQDAAWRDLLARAQRERKPIVVFFRADNCERCESFERVSVRHPMIERRLPAVVFGVLPGKAGEDAHVELFDRCRRRRFASSRRFSASAIARSSSRSTATRASCSPRRRTRRRCAARSCASGRPHGAPRRHGPRPAAVRRHQGSPRDGEARCYHSRPV